MPALRLMFTLVACLIAASGCGRQAGPRPGEAAGEGNVIGVSLLTLDNPFFKVIGTSITAEGAKHGYTTQVVTPEKDLARQHAQIKEFIVKKVAAIVLSPCDAKGIVPAIAEANAAGIPVFTVDIPCLEPGVEIVSQVCTDNEGGGRMAAEAMIEGLSGRGGKVAVLHAKKFESCRLRVKGFREVLDAHNASSDAKIVVVDEYDSNGAKDIGYKAASDALQATPDLVGIFAINDPAALGAYTAIEEAGKVGQVVLVGFDGQPEGKQAIKEGKIYADPIQVPDQMGVRVVQAIVDHYGGRTPEAEQLIPTALYRKADAERDLP
jgi:ribose transport system substrate-binding protein